MELLVLVLPSWGVFMTGYLIYKKKRLTKHKYSNDVSSRLRKIKIKNSRYINNTSSIFK